METTKEKKTCFVLIVNVNHKPLDSWFGNHVDCVAQTPEELESRIDELKNNETEFLEWYFEEIPNKDISLYEIDCEIKEVPMR